MIKLSVENKGTEAVLLAIAKRIETSNPFFALFGVMGVGVLFLLLGVVGYLGVPIDPIGRGVAAVIGAIIVVITIIAAGFIFFIGLRQAIQSKDTYTSRRIYECVSNLHSNTGIHNISVIDIYAKLYEDDVLSKQHYDLLYEHIVPTNNSIEQANS